MANSGHASLTFLKNFTNLQNNNNPMNIQQWLDSGRDYATGVKLYEKFGSNKTLKKNFGRAENKWNREKLAYELGKLRHQDGHVDAPAGDDEPVMAGPIAEVNERMSEGVNDGPGAAVIPMQEGSIAEDSEFQKSLADVPTDIKELVGKTFDVADKLHGAQERFDKIGTHPNPDVQELELQWRALYKRAATLQQQFQHANTDAERLELVKEVIDIFEEQIDPIWEKLDYFNEHGKLPEEKKKTLLDKAKEFINGKKPYSEMSDVELMKERGNLRSNISKNKDKEKRKSDVEKWRKELAEVEKLLTPKSPEGDLSAR